MLFYSVGQGAIFLWMLAAGAMVGIWYMVMRAVRLRIEAGAALSLVCDLIFGAGAAAILIAALLAADYGRVRLYQLVAAMLGAALGILALRPVSHALHAAFARAAGAVRRNRMIKVIFR